MLPLWALVALLLWWQYLDYRLLGPPMRDFRASVVEGSAAPGGKIEITYSYVVVRDCPRIVQRYWRNGRDSMIESHVGSTRGAAVGVMRKRMRSFNVPLDMPPGRAEIITSILFKCNPLADWTYLHIQPVTILPTR